MVIAQAEWQAYVQKVSGGEWPIPQGMIKDYDNWLCRSIVGRALYFRGDLEGAMRVLSTVVEVTPSAVVPKEGMSEVEHKILCLRDLAKIVWQLTKNQGAAEKFWQEAIDLAQNWQAPFHSVELAELKQEEAAMLAEKIENVER